MLYGEQPVKKDKSKAEEHWLVKNRNLLVTKIEILFTEVTCAIRHARDRWIVGNTPWKLL